MEAVVIGAGPAGTTAARTLAEKGYSVIVFEKGPLKREKPCGGGIPEVALKEFSLDFSKGRSVYGVFLCSPKNNTVTLSEKKRAGISVMRSDFDYYLVEKARKAGAEFKAHSFAQPLLKNGILQGVKTENETFQSDIAIICDGAHSRFVKMMGIYSGSDANQAVAFQYQIELDNALIEERIGNFLELYFGSQWIPSGYAWIFPKDNVVTVGNATWLNTAKKMKVDLKFMLDHFIKNQAIASQKLEGGRILYSQSHILSFPGVVQSVYGDHFMIAGDAGGFTSYATGGGVYYAMVSGKIAGEVAAEGFEQNDFSKTFLKRYKKKVDKKIGADMKWGHFLRKMVLNKDGDQERFIKAVQKDQWIRELSVLLLKEEIRYDQFLWKLLLRPQKILKFAI
ncbi:MAG: NAD(P)/FAD-dependent oxidoreductase [Theionarchaea archaeon]|nr:MAG: hypothetical protein AYK18_06120 [Theionarchaea archaeon DG-70]MBU7009476.1 NAD(P)/FAD-dependent oxidoreductase [Theionarchaea archaeon]